VTTWSDIVLIVVGVVLIGVSRLIADHFKFPGQTSTWAKTAGMADNYASALTRWIASVLTGLVFVVAGVIDLASQ
jgi:hypothetical protein